MEIIVIGGLLVAVVLAFNFGAKATASGAKVTIAKVLSDQAHDRMNFLSTLRRELANLLIWSDPERFRQLYQLVMTETATFFRDVQAVRDCFDTLAAKAPPADTLDKLRLLCGRRLMLFIGQRDYSPSDCAKAGGVWGTKRHLFNDEDSYFKK